MRDDNAFIKVQVTEEDDSITHGTAYRINSNIAITALHVVTKYKSITFIFPCNTEVENFETVYSNEDFDIALIKFPQDTVDKIATIKRIQMGSVESDDSWSGAGYPKFAEDNNFSRPMEQLKGTSYHCQKGDKFYDLECGKQAKEIKQVKDIKEWGGVSGSPVFVNNKLVGVICQHKGAIENTHFKASAIWKLLKDSKFSQHLINEQIDSEIKRQVQQWLESDSNKDLQNLLLEQGESSKGAIDRLAGYELPDLIEHLEGKKDSNSHQSQHISQFVCKLLPFYFADQAVIIDEALIGQDEKAIDLECVSEVAAECSVAAFAKRPINVSKEKGELEGVENLIVTKGKFALGPEVGIEGEKETIENFAADILNSEAAIDQLLEKYFSRKGSLDPVAMVNSRLAHYRTKGNHYYLVIRLNPQLADYQDKLTKVKAYREKYPDLIIINLSRDSEIEIKEANELLNPLPYILD